MMEKKKIAIIGTHGIPPRYGGFETFADELSNFLVCRNFEVFVQCENINLEETEYHNVKLVYSSVRKSQRPFRYYFEGSIWALKNADIILYTGTIGSIFYFLKFFYPGKILITNTDGLEHRRSKWPRYIRIFLKISEAMAVHFSDYVIADSEAIGKYLLKSYRFPIKKLKVIEYGAHLNNEINFAVLTKFSLIHQQYYLVVCRLEPENNLHIILEGYEKSGSRYPLLIVGNILENKYNKDLVKRYSSGNIRFIGGIYDKAELKALRYSCRGYVHGHSVGGTNPSLLEGMASSNLVICHNNQFNREVTESAQFYFDSVSDVMELICMVDNLSDEEIKFYGELSRKRIETYYNWEMIGNKYISLMNEIGVNTGQS